MMIIIMMISLGFFSTRYNDDDDDDDATAENSYFKVTRLRGLIQAFLYSYAAMHDFAALLAVYPAM